MIFKKILSVLFVLMVLIAFSRKAFSQDSTFITVHFLYGSKPLKQYKHSERKWFGGKLGGHVGIETDHDQVLNFVRYDKFHWIARKNHRHSRFVLHTTEGFWGIFRSPAETVKKTSIVIPISMRQRSKLDSIQQAYTSQTPYDYAFIGMRCGAATYDILAQLNILPSWSHPKTILKIFYPKKLRRRLLKKAEENHWKVIREDGTARRKWEMD